MPKFTIAVIQHFEVDTYYEIEAANEDDARAHVGSPMKLIGHSLFEETPSSPNHTRIAGGFEEPYYKEPQQ